MAIQPVKPKEEELSAFIEHLKEHGDKDAPPLSWGNIVWAIQAGRLEWVRPGVLGVVGHVKPSKASLSINKAIAAGRMGSPAQQELAKKFVKP